MIRKDKNLFHSVPKTKHLLKLILSSLFLSSTFFSSHKVCECSESLMSENEDKNEVVVWEESSLCSDGYNLSHFGFGTEALDPLFKS